MISDSLLTFQHFFRVGNERTSSILMASTFECAGLMRGFEGAVD